MLNMQPIGLELKNYWITCLRFIFPANCFACQQSLQLHDKILCESCFAQLPKLKTPLCQKCATEIPLYQTPSLHCNHCRAEAIFFDRGIAIFRYQAALKRLLQSVKFSGHCWALKAFETILTQVKTPLPIAQYDMIVPIPLDWVRIRQRDFNQAGILAKYVSKRPATPPIRSVLMRSGHRQAQSRLSRRERLENLKNIFKVRKGISVVDQNILLIDDIVTTGATMNECARALKSNGARRVDFLALARTVN